MSLCLTKDELADLTAYRRRDRQIAALVSMRVRFRVTLNGDIKVIRTDARQPPEEPVADLSIYEPGKRACCCSL